MRFTVVALTSKYSARASSGAVDHEPAILDDDALPVVEVGHGETQCPLLVVLVDGPNGELVDQPVTGGEL